MIIKLKALSHNYGKSYRRFQNEGFNLKGFVKNCLSLANGISNEYCQKELLMEDWGVVIEGQGEQEP